MCEWGIVKIITLKDWRRQGITRRIAIDECIADEVKQMNDSGIKTVNSCCGHFKNNGSVIIADDSKNLAENMGYKVQEYTTEHTKAGLLIIDLGQKLREHSK